MTETITTEDEIAFASDDYSDPPPPKYGIQSGLLCWFCGNPELVSLGFHSRAPHFPSGRHGYRRKERFYCPACGKCSVRVIHVARRRRTGWVVFETNEKGEVEMRHVQVVKRLSTWKEMEALGQELIAEGLIGGEDG